MKIWLLYNHVQFQPGIARVSFEWNCQAPPTFCMLPHHWLCTITIHYAVSIVWETHFRDISFPDSYKVRFTHAWMLLMCTHQSICVWHQTGTAWRQSSGRSSGPSPPTVGASCVWRGMEGSAWQFVSWEEGFSRASHSSLNWISSIWHYGMDCGNLYPCTALVLTTVWEDNYLNLSDCSSVC